MKVAGIVCEYNPFHNGHRYHIQQTKKVADACICIMSGNFVQRGDAACVNKFARAEAAVLNGADLVLELPTVFACRSAETFARGAVSLLEQTGVVSLLSFGSESGNNEEILRAATFFSNESEAYQKKLGEELAKGFSFPVARANAVKNQTFSFLLDTPNDLLGIEYCKAIKQLGLSIAPHLVLRKATGHHEQQTKGDFCSAGYLRNHPEKLELFSPASNLLKEKGFPVNKALLHEILHAHLRRVSADELAITADCSEGLEHRLKAAAQCESLEEAIQHAKTKRYTQTRIQRVILNSYLGITKKTYQPEYLRVLCGNKKGAELLKTIKQKGSLPVITNLSKQKINSEALEIDCKAGDFYALLQTKNRRSGMDYTTSPRFFEEEDTSSER